MLLRMFFYHLQDRYAGLTGSMPFRGGLRGAPRGHGRGGFRGGGFRGGFRGGLAQAGGGRDFSNQELYADYNGPDQQSAYGGSAGYSAGGGGGTGGGGGSGGYNSGSYAEGQPSQQIMVRNVRVVELCVMSFVTDCFFLTVALVNRKRGFGRTF